MGPSGCDTQQRAPKLEERTDLFGSREKLLQ